MTVASNVTVEILAHYSLVDAQEIGALLPTLSADLAGDTIDQNLLKEIIESPYHDQIVARVDGRIVGIATLSTTIGTAAGRKLYLEDFVVDSTIQGKGIGSAVWQVIEDQCRNKKMPLHFTSRPARLAAHEFYLKHGATVYDTTVFHWKEL